MAPLKFEASLLSLRADLRHFSRPEIFPSYLNILTEKWVFGNKCRASGKLQLSVPPSWKLKLLSEVGSLIPGADQTARPGAVCREVSWLLLPGH